jgi:hypothetical protein
MIGDIVVRDNIRSLISIRGLGKTYPVVGSISATYRILQYGQPSGLRHLHRAFAGSVPPSDSYPYQPGRSCRSGTCCCDLR